MWLEQIAHWFRLGGFTLALLLVASLAGLSIALERLLVLWGARAKSQQLSAAINNHLLRGDWDAARSAAERSTAVSAEMFRAGFQKMQSAGGPGLEAAVERERIQTQLKLRARIWLLGTIAATTPFVGLFGTVAGVMKSFRDLGLDVESGGAGGSAAVMSGISEALVATAAGILIAVVAMVFYNFFQARLGQLSVELRLSAEEFVELLREKVPPKNTSIDLTSSSS